MASASVDDEAIWKALANGLRRQMLDELRDAPLSTGELSSRFDESRHVVLQHLQVLREAGLVLVEKRGRVRMNHLNPVPIQGIHQRWVAKYQAHWAGALLGLKDAVEGGDTPLAQDDTVEDASTWTG